MSCLHLFKLDLATFEQYWLWRVVTKVKGDVRALPMKMFNTNYHYINVLTMRWNWPGLKDFWWVPRSQRIRSTKVGPFTFLHYSTFKKMVWRFSCCCWSFKAMTQLDEPLLLDLTAEENFSLEPLSTQLLADKKYTEVLIQTYLVIPKDATWPCNLPVDGIGLDFMKARKHLNPVKGGFPADKTLYAGIVNGKNIWRQQLWKAWKFLGSSSSWKLSWTTSCSFFMCHLQMANEDLNQLFWTTPALRMKNWAELRDLDAIRNGQGAEALKRQQRTSCNERVGANAGTLPYRSFAMVVYRLYCSPHVETSSSKLPLPIPSVHSLNQ